MRTDGIVLLLLNYVLKDRLRNVNASAATAIPVASGTHGASGTGSAGKEESAL